MDGFDLLPDSLILQIFNHLSDVKSLIRCRSVSERFNSLVPQTDSLLLHVDYVISSEPHSSLLSFFKSIFNYIFSPDPVPGPSRSPTSPAQILSQFERIRSLQIVLPAGDLKLDPNVVVKWRAEFGKSLRSCVILGHGGGSADGDFGGGLKTRVVWTISALIAASARHYLLKEVVREHREMERVVLRDREGEGVLVMEKEGLRECCGGGGEGDGWDGSNRTVVPSVRMRMRHVGRVELGNGAWVEGVTLVVVRPCGVKSGDDVDDAELAMGAFGGGAYGEAVRVLLKSKSYLLEMNSF